jgi:hypothetical protein
MTAFWLPVTRYGKARRWESLDAVGTLQKIATTLDSNSDCFIKNNGTPGSCLNSKLRGLD